MATETTRRTRDGLPGGEGGMILVVCLVLVVALAGIATAFMGSGVTESSHRQASLRRTRVLYVAEVGISRAIADLNAGGTGIFGSEDAQIPFAGGGFYVTAADNGDETFTVRSVGQIKEQKRAIEGIAAPTSYCRFPKALVGNLELNASGSMFVDGYDSALGTYASQAVNVDPETGATYARATGNVAANGDIVLGGGAVIMGDATPGPGHSVRVGGGSVHVDGSTAPAAVALPVVPVPYEPPIASSGSVVASSNMHIDEGTYHFDSLTVKNNKEIEIAGNVVIYIDGTFDLQGSGRIHLEDGASLEIHHNGPTFTLNGTAVVNNSQVPTNLTFYTNATTLRLNGASGFYGTIFAPEADAQFNGSNELFGAIVAKHVDVVGTARIHFDETLLRSEEESRLTLSSWRRVPAD